MPLRVLVEVAGMVFAPVCSMLRSGFRMAGRPRSGQPIGGGGAITFLGGAPMS